MQTTSARRRVLEVAGLFLKLGTLSFGGPAAHTAFMQREVVDKRAWISHEGFLDMLAVVNLVPGPNSTEMAIHIGYVHAGWAGLVVGGLAFLTPAALISLALAVVYQSWGRLPAGLALFYGMNPVVVAIVWVATYRLGRAAIKGWRDAALGVACAAASLLGVHELAVLLAAGLVGLVAAAPWGGAAAGLLLFYPLLPALLPLAAAWRPSRIVQVGLYFLRVGATLLGSGMVFYAYVQRDLVLRYAWMTRQQLVDAITVGQMTPGPVLSSATFIGYLIAGVPGALLSTAAIFLPSFLIVAAVGPWVPRLRKSARAHAFLDGVNVAVVSLILVVSVSLLRAAVVDVWTALILLASLAALLRWRADAWWLVLGGALAGLLHYLVAR